MRRPRRRLMTAFLAVCTAVMMAGLMPAGADPGVDLAITGITDSHDPVKESNVVRYRVDVKNVGVGDGSNPMNLFFYVYEVGGGDFSIAAVDPVIESASGTGWSCEESEGWTCTDGTLAAGAEANPVFVYVRAPSHQTTIELYAEVYSDDSEITYLNNSDTESTDVVLSSSCEGQVSCGSGFVAFDQDTSVTTGPLSAKHWLVGTTFFEGVPGASGGVVFNMAAVKRKDCSVPGCAFQMNLDPIPAVYPVGNVKLVLLCHPSKCPPTLPATLGLLLLFKIAEDNIPVPVLRCVDGLLPITCFTAKRLPSGVLKVVVKNLTSGDPKIAGRCIAGC